MQIPKYVLIYDYPDKAPRIYRFYTLKAANDMVDFMSRICIDCDVNHVEKYCKIIEDAPEEFDKPHSHEC